LAPKGRWFAPLSYCLAMRRRQVLRELEEGRYVWFALVWAMVAAAALIWGEGRGNTFFSDEWGWLFGRPAVYPGVEEFLAPSNGHLLLVPLLVYRGLSEVFGIDTYSAFQAVSIGLNLLCSGLLFAYLRRRVPPWLALGAAALMMVFGAGWETVMSSLGIGAMLSVAAGLGMLIVLDRRDLRGDLAACALLILSVISFGTGLSFAAGATLSVSIRQPPWRWQRAWVWAFPLAIYAAWTLWALSYDQNPLALSHLAHVVPILFDSIAAVTIALLGLFRDATAEQPSFRLDLGVPLAFLLIGALIWRTARLDSERRGLLLVPLAVALSFWVLLALAYDPPSRGVPTASRYIYPGAVFILLVAAEAVRDLRLSPLAWLLCGLGLASALVANLTQLHDGQRFLANTSDYVKTELAALELSRERVEPSFAPEGPELQPLFGDRPMTIAFLNAYAYFPVRDMYGSPAFPADELPRRSVEVRKVADIVLARALQLKLTALDRPAPTTATAVPGDADEPVSLGLRDCLIVRPGPDGSSPALALPAGGVTVDSSAGAPASVYLRRFGDGFDVALGDVPGDGVALLALPPDASPHPWQAVVRSSQPVRICGGAARNREP
jgi:hypothetical protein